MENVYWETIKLFEFEFEICILMQISLKYVPRSPIINMPALVQIITQRRTDNKPLSESKVA